MPVHANDRGRADLGLTVLVLVTVDAALARPSGCSQSARQSPGGRRPRDHGCRAGSCAYVGNAPSSLFPSFRGIGFSTQRLAAGGRDAICLIGPVGFVRIFPGQQPFRDQRF